MDLRKSFVEKNKEIDIENKNTNLEKLNDSKHQLSSFDEIDNSQNIDQNKQHIVDLNTRNEIFSAILAITSALSFSIMIGFCKIAYIHNPHLTGFDYVLIRSFSMGVLAASNVVYQKVDIFDIKPKYRLLMLLRCLTGGIGMPCFFLGLKYIPSSKATLITNINPLIVAILSYFILKEAIKKSTVIALLGAFIGVTLFSLHKNESVNTSDHYILGL